MLTPRRTIPSGRFRLGRVRVWAALAIGLGISSGFATARADDVKVLDREDFAISVSFPSDWTSVPGEDPILYRAKSPDENDTDEFNENCVLTGTAEPATKDLDETVNWPHPGENEFLEFEQGERKIVPFGGGRAIRSEHRYTIKGMRRGKAVSVRVKALEYSFFSNFGESGSQFFVLKCTAHDPAYDRWNATFEKVAQSVAFGKSL